VGGFLGFAPTPYASGETSREQGISKAGNRAVKALMTELAWAWLRHQPQSGLSRWYQTRFAHGGKRMRKVGIVAVGRKLLIALWRYVEFGGHARRRPAEGGRLTERLERKGLRQRFWCSRPFLPPGALCGPLVRWGREMKGSTRSPMGEWRIG
jgi:Transposase IS116/IS110/IS902 family